MESSIQIEEKAGQWLARRDSGDWSGADEAAFNAWLEQSTLHVVAFVRLEGAWKQAKRLKALGTGVPSESVPSPDQWQLASFFRPKGGMREAARASEPMVELQGEVSNENKSTRQGAGTVRWQRWAVAATLLIAIAVGFSMYSWPFDSTYRTAVGGIASVPMSDGSKVTLNTDSKIRLAVTDTERRVELEHGEAFFDVAKDPSRPFVVTVGDKRVVAVGTQFSVLRDKNDIRVFITEGQVRIESEKPSAEGTQSAGDTLSAGTIARTRRDSVLVQEKTIAEVEGYLSWRTGYLIFNNTVLSEAVAEFNRYNVRKIVIADHAVEEIQVSGKFRSNQFEAFVRLLEDGFPVRARREGQQIMLTSVPR